MASERVNRSSASYDLAAVSRTLRNEIFLSSLYQNPLSTDDQRIATLHDNHVLVIFVDMLR